MPSPAHSVRAPLLWLLLPLMAGLVLARIVPPPPGGLWPVILSAALAAAIALWTERRNLDRSASALLTLAAGLAGFALLHLRYPQLHVWDTRPPREITLTIKVSRLFGSTATSRQVSGLGRVTAAEGDESALLHEEIYFSAIRRVSVPTRPAGEYTVHGVLEPLAAPAPGDGFADYLANQGIRHQITRARVSREVAPPGAIADMTEKCRARLKAILRHGLERHPSLASLYLAMLLGEKAALNPAQEEAFMRSGTFHVFSVSGLHVGVIAMALYLLLTSLRVPRRPGTVITLVVLWLYVEITGGGTPSIRAFVMTASLLASRAFHLPGNAFAALAVSALTTLLLDPLQLFSTGFQMSYAVVAGLILMGGPLAERWLQHWNPFVLRPRPEWTWWHESVNWGGRQVITAVAGCWVAFLASAPSGIGFFGFFSPGSLLANLIVLPLSSLAIVAGFLAILTGLLGLLPLSALFNSAAALLLLATDWLIGHGTQLPGVYFPATFRADWLASAGMGLMLAAMLAGAAVRWHRRWGGFWCPVGLLVVLLIFGVKFGPG